ncbi:MULTISPECIES: hypothetical protein [unclassified Shewanella]|uniref:hypothetical protein n=1 Tax=unclassified Shewanella TaxID=196818 RepID=UPI0039B394D9
MKTSKLPNVECLVLIGLFFPFFMVVPISSEIQPVSLFIWLISCLLIGRVPKELLVLCFSLFACAILSLIVSIFSDDIPSVKDFAISFVLFFVPIITFVFVKNSSAVESRRAFMFVLSVWFLFSLVQTFIPNFFKITGVESIINIFIPRFLSGAAENGRGVTSLAPEPSYAAYVYLSLVVWLWYLKVSLLVSRRMFTFSFFTLIFCLLMNKSFFGVLVLLFSIFLFIKIRYLFFVVLVSFVFLFGALGGESEGRLVSFLMLLRNVTNFHDLMILFQTFSSTREVGVMVGYSSLFSNPLGVGVGNGSAHFSEILGNFSFILMDRYQEIVNPESGGSGRPYAYVSFMFFEVGLLFLLPLLVFMAFNLKYLFCKCLLRNNSFFVLFLALVLVSLRSPVSMPCAFIMMGLLIRSLLGCKVNSKFI